MHPISKCSKNKLACTSCKVHGVLYLFTQDTYSSRKWISSWLIRQRQNLRKGAQATGSVRVKAESLGISTPELGSPSAAAQKRRPGRPPKIRLKIEETLIPIPPSLPSSVAVSPSVPVTVRLMAVKDEHQETRIPSPASHSPLAAFSPTTVPSQLQLDIASRHDNNFPVKTLPSLETTEPQNHKLSQSNNSETPTASPMLSRFPSTKSEDPAQPLNQFPQSCEPSVSQIVNVRSRPPLLNQRTRASQRSAPLFTSAPLRPAPLLPSLLPIVQNYQNMCYDPPFQYMLAPDPSINRAFLQNNFSLLLNHAFPQNQNFYSGIFAPNLHLFDNRQILWPANYQPQIVRKISL